MEREQIITMEPSFETERQETSRRDDRNQAASPSQTEDGFSGPLLPPDASQEMRSRWESIQAAFVDDPRSVVRQADELVDTAIKRLSETFTNERGKLEQQWSAGNDVSTEDLRLALRRYRAFFHRLLAA